jgi:hypothetical protein
VFANRCSPVALFLAALLAPSLARADSGGWTHVFDAPSSETLRIQDLRRLPEGGYAVIGSVPGRDVVHQRFDPQGQAQGPVRIGWPAALRSPGAVQPDVLVHEQRGGWVTRPLPPLLPCRRDDRGGFEARGYPHDYSYGHGRGQLDAEGGGFGYGWMRPTRVFRHAADCTLQDFGTVGFGIRALYNSSAAVLAYAAATDHPHQSFPVQTLLVFDRDGLRLSRTFELDGETLADLSLLQEVDGDVIIGGSGTARGALFRVGPEGQIRWQTAIDGAAYFDFGWPHPHADGLMVYAASSRGIDRGPFRLLQLDPQSGALRLRASIDHAHWVRPVHPPVPRGDELLLLRFLPDSDLVRVYADGRVETLRALPSGFTPRLWLNEQDVLLSRDIYQQIAGMGSTQLGIDLWRLALTSDALPQRLDDIELPWPVRLGAASLDGAGSEIALWQQGRIIMHAFDAAGGTRWQRSLPPHEPGGHPTRPLVQSVLRGVDISCLHQRRLGMLSSSGPSQRSESSLSCLRRSDGALLFAHTDLNDSDDPLERRWTLPLAVLPGSDDGVSVLVRNLELLCSPCRHRIEQIDIGVGGDVHRRLRLADSEQLRHTVLATRDGELLLLASEAGSRRLLRLATDDSSQDFGLLPSSWDALEPITGAIHADGTIRLLGSAENGSRLLSLDADGVVLNDLALDGRLADVLTKQLFVSRDHGAALVTDVDGRLHLHRVDPDGNLRWWRDIGSAMHDRVRGLFLPGPDADDAGVRVALVRDARLLLRGFADIDGADNGFTIASLVGQADDPLHPPPFDATPADPIVDAPGWSDDGALLYAEHGAAPLLGQPQPPRLHRIELPSPTGLPPARPALIGFWFDPGSSGEGLYLEHFPAGQIGGAWMTYTVEGGTDRAAQRWYSLGGTAGADAAAVELTILQSSGGQFGAPPAIDAQPVGVATLRRLDCGRVQLDYRFDAEVNDAAAGSLTLVALVPGSGCMFTVSASTTGAWYAADFPGQGVMLQGFGGAAGDAQLAGAWFTFDVAGQADDPTAQHWFTLFGERDDATHGGYQLQLMRTIGGRFDGPATANRVQVGSARFELQSCDRAMLEYDFDAGGAAAEFAALQGQVELQRVGGCAAP